MPRTPPATTPNPSSATIRCRDQDGVSVDFILLVWTTGTFVAQSSAMLSEQDVEAFVSTTRSTGLAKITTRATIWDFVFSLPMGVGGLTRRLQHGQGRAGRAPPILLRSRW